MLLFRRLDFIRSSLFIFNRRLALLYYLYAHVVHQCILAQSSLVWIYFSMILKFLILNVNIKFHSRFALLWLLLYDYMADIFNNSGHSIGAVYLIYWLYETKWSYILQIIYILGCYFLLCLRNRMCQNYSTNLNSNVIIFNPRSLVRVY